VDLTYSGPIIAQIMQINRSFIPIVLIMSARRIKVAVTSHKFHLQASSHP
jgi:hypothetical protein